MRGENLTAFGQPVARDNEYQHASRFQPAIGVAQERLLGTATVSRSQSPIVGRVQVEKTEALDGALHLQRISLDDIGDSLPGLLGAVGIKLNAIAQYVGTAGDNLERHTMANTRVYCGGLCAWELEESTD
jgi:hypothetical protein